MKSHWIEIDLAALRHNCRALQHLLGAGTKMLAVVKSDAYGHGMIPVARTLHEQGVGAFGVAEVHEGVMLRQAGISGDIVVFLGAVKESLPDVAHHVLQPVVFGRDQAAEISRFACSAGTRIGVHLKVDTGMGRLGILPEEVAGFVSFLKGEKGIYLAGVMSHFPLADMSDSRPCLEQNRLFAEVLKLAGKAAGGVAVAHIANSAAMFRYPDMHWDMVRPGISLYGCYAGDGEWAGKDLLKPVMSFKSRIIQVKDVPAGSGVSYGHTYVTGRPSRLAILPVGYNDGYLRALSNRAEVLVRGQRAPQRGRICMNVTVIDVTDIPGVCAGDEVTLMGMQQGRQISAEEVADWMGTINYEVLCLFGNNNSRVYVAGKK
ncbi:MAG: alanine racemase [Desulfobulbaceae bacterium]|nr:alanine racemase [Desulfobulbaceae bacterium]